MRKVKENKGFNLPACAEASTYAGASADKSADKPAFVKTTADKQD
jgi:hypothetical protein